MTFQTTVNTASRTARCTSSARAVSTKEAYGRRAGGGSGGGGASSDLGADRSAFVGVARRFGLALEVVGVDRFDDEPGALDVVSHAAREVAPALEALVHRFHPPPGSACGPS